MNHPDKVLFLDIDGVLNSKAYDRERTEEQGNIDETRLPLLKRIIDETGAAIVLASSWRRHWEGELSRCDEKGKDLRAQLARYQLSIHDKTPCLPDGDRAEEIRAWLSAHPHVRRFAILDDIALGWGGDLQDHLVKTNERIGRGLEERHVRKAIELLTD